MNMQSRVVGVPLTKQAWPVAVKLAGKSFLFALSLILLSACGGSGGGGGNGGGGESAVYTITATFGANGSISPSGNVTVSSGSSQAFVITPDASYYVLDVLVDGTSVDSQVAYTFTNVTANHTISATFEAIPINTNVITATAGIGGGISPSGTVLVEGGGDKTFTITPDSGHIITDVLVDGASVGSQVAYASGSQTAYTFTNVTADHTISATFEIIPLATYDIVATSGENGSISPSGTTTVDEGVSQPFTITPDTGYYVLDVLVDGISVESQTAYTFTNVTADHTISATFEVIPPNAYVITATAYQGGSVSPSGTVPVQEGTDKTFTITPDSGYYAGDVSVDGVSQGAIETYDFTNVTADHTIYATFYNIVIGPVSGISSGMNFSVLLQKAGTVLAWGSNSDGQLGNGTNNDSSIPVRVSGLTDVIAVTAGGHHALAIKSDGTLWAWGDNDDVLQSTGATGGGALGNGTMKDSNVPVQVCAAGETVVPCVNFLSDVVAVAAGRHHSLALKGDNTVWVWGAGADLVPRVGIDGGGTPYHATAITTGRTFSLALTPDKTVMAFGGNFFGTLGNGTTIDSLTPVQVSGLTNVTAIAAGMYHSLALDGDGTVWTWGRNHEGQLGTASAGTCTEFDDAGSSIGTSFACSMTPVPVSGLTNITAISGGRYQSYALDASGDVWSWGSNSAGQLGNGTTVGSATPVRVSGLASITAITDSSAYSWHSLVLDVGGIVWAWGSNGKGELGDGTTTGSLTPTPVLGSGN